MVFFQEPLFNNSQTFSQMEIFQMTGTICISGMLIKAAGTVLSERQLLKSQKKEAREPVTFFIFVQRIVVPVLALFLNQISHPQESLTYSNSRQRLNL